MSQSQTTRKPSCWNCKYMHKSNTRDISTYECMNTDSRKYLKSKGYDYIPELVMLRGCSKWVDYMTKDDKKPKEDNQRGMF